MAISCDQVKSTRFCAPRAQSPGETPESQRLKPWLDEGAPKELVTGDKDVFGDGSVVMIATPGQYALDEVPKHNSSAAETLASFARFRTLTKSLQATVIIQHEPADVLKLAPFPNAAE